MEERGQHVCGEADAGRLDTVLARARTELSRARWQEEIKADRVTVNGQPGRCKMRVVPGDVIDWTRPRRLQSKPRRKIFCSMFSTRTKT
ncbi:MAG: S4 domain-containing protein [Kiritimatiellae bacterium]|nr:S4 domain-containing protein [Kiritimatiellia bacterium]